MCRFCGEGGAYLGGGSRRVYQVSGAEGGGASAAIRAAGAHEVPAGSGEAGRRLLIRGGHVLSMDAAVGDFAEADVLVSGRRIEAIGPDLDAGGAEVVDATGMIVMPGFVDTHHHLF